MLPVKNPKPDARRFHYRFAAGHHQQADTRKLEQALRGFDIRICPDYRGNAGVVYRGRQPVCSAENASWLSASGEVD